MEESTKGSFSITNEKVLEASHTLMEVYTKDSGFRELSMVKENKSLPMARSKREHGMKVISLRIRDTIA